VTVVVQVVKNEEATMTMEHFENSIGFTFHCFRV